MAAYLQRLLDTAAPADPVGLAPVVRSSSPIFEQDQLLALTERATAPAEGPLGDPAGEVARSSAPPHPRTPSPATMQGMPAESVIGTGPNAAAAEPIERLDPVIKVSPPLPTPARPEAALPAAPVEAADMPPPPTIAPSSREPPHPPDPIPAPPSNGAATILTEPPRVIDALLHPEPPAVAPAKTLPIESRPSDEAPAAPSPVQAAEPAPIKAEPPRVDLSPKSKPDPPPAPPPYPETAHPPPPTITIGRINVEIVEDRPAERPPARPLTAAAASVIGPLGQARAARRLLALRRL